MPLVRVSVANLAWYVRMKENNVRYPFAILNPDKLAKGERRYMALGGGAMLNEAGKKMLEEVVGASGFEFDTGIGFYDARFRICERDLESAFKTFSSVDTRGATIYEQDPTLDIMAELSGKEFPGYPTIMSAEETELVRLDFVKVVRQKLPAAGADTSARGVAADVPTHRLFRIFELVMPLALYQGRMMSSPVVKILSNQELATTDGGSKAGVTRDGLIIQNNLFV